MMLIREDVFKILENSVGISNITNGGQIWVLFLLFSWKDEWLGLKEYHPELFEHAKNIEEHVKKYSWKDDTLEEVEKGIPGVKKDLDEIVERAKGKKNTLKNLLNMRNGKIYLQMMKKMMNSV